MGTDIAPRKNNLPTAPSLPASVRPLLEGKAGESRFSEDGTFLGCVEHWSVPTTITDEQRQDIKTSLAKYELFLAPARLDETAGRLAALLSHYWVGQMPESLQALVASDWLEDIGEFPAWAIEEACRRWRRTEVKRPKPAEIRSMCQEAVRVCERHRSRLRAMMRPEPKGATSLAAIIDGSVRRMDVDG